MRRVAKSPKPKKATQRRRRARGGGDRFWLLRGGLAVHAPDPERGSVGRALSRAIDWLIDHCGDDGYFYYERDEISRMHGQGYALLALTQAYGMYVTDAVQHRRLHDAIVRGVTLIESAQGTLGGWYYEPRKMDAHEGSITVCMLQALRAAKDTGFAVDGGDHRTLSPHAGTPQAGNRRARARGCLAATRDRQAGFATRVERAH